MKLTNTPNFYAQRCAKDRLIHGALSPPLRICIHLSLPSKCEASHFDGFGEGFEQRGIKVGSGELYVSLWDSGDQFFIDTEREFHQRLGVELPEQTPAQAALNEPDASDDPRTASLRLELIERLDANLSGFFDTLRGLDGQEIADMSSEIGARMDAHYYLSELRNFHTSEAEYLLQFQNPLEVVADEFIYAGTEERSDIMWRIFDRQDALQGDYPLINDEPSALVAPEKAAPVTRDELLEQIAKKHCRFETLETRNRDSLDFHEVSVWGFKAALEEAYKAGLSRQLSQMKGVAHDEARHDPGERPSVMDRIREAAKTPKEPRRDKPQRDKSGPEL